MFSIVNCQRSHLDWLNVWISMLTCVYLRRILSVSSSVLNEFISTNGTFALYSLFKLYALSYPQHDNNHLSDILCH